MGTKTNRQVKIAATSFLLAGCVLTTCAPWNEKCGDGDYYCSDIVSTRPFIRPVKSIYGGASHVLFSDGTLAYVIRDPNETLTIDLKEICDSDTICDIIPFHYSYHNADSTTEAIITPQKCCILYNNNLIREIGVVGADTTTLLFAISAAINTVEQIYILDSGDSYVKIFDATGQFQGRFLAGSNPSKIRNYQNHIYILDMNDENIKEFNEEGESTGRMTPPGYLQDARDFAICDGVFVVADRAGNQLTILSLTGEIFEVKTGYCLNDVSFTFANIISLTPDYNSFWVVDYEKNLVIRFMDRLWEETDVKYE